MLMEYENKFCAFIDILGFKNLMLEGFDKAVQFYDRYMAYFNFMAKLDENIHNQIKDGYDLEHYIFSDSIIITSKNWNVFCQHIANTCSWMLEQGFLFRGGIGFGKIYDHSQFPDVKMVSEGLVEAVVLESTYAKYPRVLLSENALNEILKSVTNIHQVNQLFMQCEDSRWCLNPFFLLPDIEPIIKMVNHKIAYYQGKTFVDKYEWLGELINYCFYWSAEASLEDYFTKSRFEKDVAEKVLCKTSFSSTLKFKFIYPRMYMQKKVDLRIYSQSFEENAEYITSLD